MKITDIKIDGFGVWNDLTLRRISPEITVFYGPNEAGKTTLMQFLRSVLYGVSAKRRERYLPPLAGGRPGGWLKIDGDDGTLQVSRYADRGPNDFGKVTVLTSDGQEQGDRLLRESLEQVDEGTYNNIFAVGLREVQELGSLSGTAAAQWLYRLTSGLDRISLYDVIHLLGASRVRLLNSAEKKSDIRELLTRRETLQGELEQLIVKGRRWSQSAVKLREMAEEIDRRQAEQKQIEAQARLVEIAIGLKPLWSKRDKIDDRLLAFQHLVPLEDGTLDTLDDLNKRIENHQRQRDVLIGQRHQLRDEAQRLGINDMLFSNAPRLEALAEQQMWLESLEREIEELGEKVEQVEARLESENERLSQQWTGKGSIPPRITAEIVEQITPQLKAIEAAEELVASTTYELEHRRSGEDKYRSQIESAMTGGDKFGLPKDIDGANDLVAQLRRRLQVEQRLEKARHDADELQQQSQELVDEQVVPISLFSWLLALFVSGFVLLAVWWLLPDSALGQYGGWLAALGIGGSVFAWMFKYFAEDSAANRLQACQKQMELVAKQIEEAQAAQQKLDIELPMTEGSVVLRLQHAEKHLAELERMLPVESKRREVEQEVVSFERRLQLAQEKLAAALANWKSKLKALGLPEDIGPADLATMAGQYEQLGELEHRLENRRDDLDRREREFETVSKRIFTLAEETGLVLEEEEEGEGVEPLAQLDHLLAEYHQQKHRVAQREQLAEKAKELKTEESRHARAVVGLGRRREALFQKCDVDDEHGLRQLADRLVEAAELRDKRASLTREIAAAIGKHGTEVEFEPLMAPESIGRLDAEWEDLSAQLEELDTGLKEVLERRGALVQQQRTLADDDSLSQKQLDLDVVEQQIKRSCDAWRERSAVSLLLERIRHDYEEHRQPETLQEASKYLSQLTSGKYKRIWTPLANDILLVDTADGESLPVDVLSRGTREQLFVSLRLALVAAFARRGIHLPMILDDVFVNFDAKRTQIAVQVIREFAEQGHQLLVFTCHEHVWRMFVDMKIDARRLPDRHQGEHGDEEDEIIDVILDGPIEEPDPVPALPAPEAEVAEVVELDEEEVAETEPVEEVVEPVAEVPIESPQPRTAPPNSEVEYSWSEPFGYGWNGAHAESGMREAP